MEQLVTVTGIAVPILRINIDTDQIIPVREMVNVVTDDYGPGLFANWRYVREREPNPDFILNQEPWRRATILLAGRNFGCGSSRELAPKALRHYGFRAVIAPSFGGIFFNNCFRNGLVPVELDVAQVEAMAAQMTAAGGHRTVTVDLAQQTVTAPDGSVFSFRAPPPLRRMLLEGLDEIALTLSRGAEIGTFRDADRRRRPWAYPSPADGRTSRVAK
jgi:3-isopropylmalate/(R)-2-methylmalate dehydratase small subunit